MESEMKEKLAQNVLALVLVVAVGTAVAMLLSGCGFTSERAKYARLTDHVDQSVGELDAVTPPTDPRKPGLAVLKAETEGVSKALPVVPEAERMKPIPFVASVAAAAAAKQAALSAGKSAPEADALALQSAAAVVAGQGAQVDAAIQNYTDAADAADAAPGIIGSIVSGIGTVAGIFGPIGAGVAGLLGIGMSIYTSVKKKKIAASFKATVRGVEKGVQLIKKDGLAGEAAQKAIYGALRNAHETLTNVAEVAAQVVKIKADMRAGK